MGPVAAVAFLLLLTSLAPWGSAAPPLGPEAAIVLPRASLATVVGGPATDDWPTYLGSVARTSANSVDPSISAQTARQLSQLWSYATNGTVAASPAVVNGTVYVGSWDGYEYALRAADGSRLWRTYLGVDSTCGYQLGVTSSATVVSDTVYVGGGAGHWYALNAANGAVRWSVATGNISQGYYNWASPLIFGGFAYIGIASDCDHPLVPGALLKVNLASHAVVGRVSTVPVGGLGASIWSSPSLDAQTGILYVTTGNPGGKSTPYGEAILAIRASTFRVIDHWQVPNASAKPDGDFGATPALFTDSRGHALVAALNKNGYLYVWDRANLHQGPRWTAYPGPGIVPGAVGGGHYFVGTGRTAIGAKTYNGTLRSYSLGSGRLLFSVGLPMKVFGAPLWVNGVVVVGSANELSLFAEGNGTLLARFSCTGNFLGAPVAAEGRLYAGCSNGHVMAYGLPVRATASASPSVGSAPLKVDFQGRAVAGVPSYQYVWSFGDGSANVSGTTASHIYRHKGTFAATLTVTDSSGARCAATRTIQVQSPTARPAGISAADPRRNRRAGSRARRSP